MKKIIIFLFSILLIGFFNVTTNAEVMQKVGFVETKKEVSYLENGNYLVIKVKEQNSEIITRGTSYYKTGQLEVAEYNKNDKVLWTYTLTGTFLIETGISCISTNATYSTEIYNSVWSFSDGSTSYANNYVRGLGTFKRKILLITTQTIDIDVTLYCDSYGNIS